MVLNSNEDPLKSRDGNQLYTPYPTNHQLRMKLPPTTHKLVNIYICTIIPLGSVPQAISTLQSYFFSGSALLWNKRDFFIAFFFLQRCPQFVVETKLICHKITSYFMIFKFCQDVNPQQVTRTNLPPLYSTFCLFLLNPKPLYAT